MEFEIILLISIVILFILLFIFRKNPIVKKYWKYSLILIPALLFLILRIIQKKKTGETGEPAGGFDLNQEINKIKEDLQEVNTVAAIEVSAAKEKNKEKLEQLKEVAKIEDSKERRKKLAELMG